MNMLSIAPQLVLHFLQTMNTRNETLDKRGNGKEMFKAAPTTAPTTTPITASAQPPEYTPSIEDQYLPKSIRGSNNNPYSIMNAVTETIQKPGAATATAATATNDPIPSTSIEIETVVESTQKEVVIEPIQSSSSSSSSSQSTVNHAL